MSSTENVTGLVAAARTTAIADGDMRVLDGFGIYKQVAAPRTTGGSAFNVVTPMKPTVIVNQTLVRLDGETYVFSARRGRWTSKDVTSDVEIPLTGDQRGSLKEIMPGRLVTIRVLEQVPEELIILMLDEHLGMPILALGNIRMTGYAAHLTTEWHPEGYMPTWLQQMNPLA